MPTEEQVVDAVLAAANAALPESVRAYEPGRMPATKPREFVTVSVVRRAGGSARAGRHATTGWVAYFMGASNVVESNARKWLQLIGDALENQHLIVSGESSTPVRFDNGRAVAPDDTWFTVVHAYHFAI